jgi:putative ABC transport system permease protein
MELEDATPPLRPEGFRAIDGVASDARLSGRHDCVQRCLDGRRDLLQVVRLADHVANVRSMDDVMRDSTARANLNMVVLTIFDGMALVLAVIGIYGVMGYSVRQRTREIGIRVAVGAEAHQVRARVLRQGMRLALLGVSIGLVSVFALTRVLATFLFGVTPHDAVVFISVPVVLSAAALVGVWLPARRATQIDPVDALRAE